MSDPMFTPGPWLADPMVPKAKGAFYIVGNLDGNNATVDVATVGPTLSPRAEANARLIAAAPDLYAAVKTLLAAADHAGGLGGCDPELEAACKVGSAAIAKANHPIRTQSHDIAD